jgi:acetyl-CoA C-acetyltransferase
MGVCIVGWAHTPFGRLDSMDLEALISTVAIMAYGRCI